MKTGKILLALALVLVGAVICAGCISSTSPSPEGEWVLTTDENIFITFNPDGTVSGKAPVNGFGGTYVVDGDKLTFGDDIIQTLMAGSEEAMKAEAEFFAALKNTALWSVHDGKLFLADADNHILLIFTASILGEWDGENGTIIFAADGTVRGHAPINGFSGSYTAFGNSLVFENMIMTEMAGSPEDMKAETEFITALNAAAGFVVSGNTLVLVDAEGKALLSFERHFEPAGTWVLADDERVTITFNGDGSVNGQAQVNLFGGQCFIHGSFLSFGDGFQMTEMAGLPADMKAEDAFIKALGKTAGFTFEDGKLIFVDAKGKELLEFKRV